jgi:hypothetical protein
MEILFGLFKSGLPKEEVLKKLGERAHKYHEVKGLLQKLYVHDESTGHFGGIYIFDSKASLEAFKNSELSKSTGDAYKFTEPPTTRVLNVVLELYREKQHVT